MVGTAALRFPFATGPRRCEEVELAWLGSRPSKTEPGDLDRPTFGDAQPATNG
jgi:hypothetical protein